MSEICFKTDSISLGYGKSLVVENLQLEIATGKTTAFLGANGSGKSTILKGLSGQLKPMKGDVELKEVAISAMAAKEIAKRIAVLAQHADTPADLNVEHLVRMGRYPYLSIFERWSDAHQKACDEAIKLTGMVALRKKALSELSGGQLQRAWISLALAQQTEILLLDEPTTFLDLAHQLEIMELMKQLVRKHGKTVVAVMHDINQAANYADEVVLLKDGQIIAQGLPEEVITSENLLLVYGVEVTQITDSKTKRTYFNPNPIKR